MPIVTGAGSSAMAEVEVREISIVPAVGHYRIHVALDVIPYRNATGKVQLSEFNGLLGVKTSDSSLLVTRLLPRDLGLTIELGDFGRDVLWVEGDIDDRRLEALEDIRAGGALTFLVELHSSVWTNSSRTRSRVEVPYPLSKGAWVEKFGVIGATRTMLLEIPDVSPTDDARLGLALKHLGGAHSELLAGEWRKSVAACRESLEALRTDESEPQRDEAWNALFRGTRSWDKAQRLAAVRQALAAFSHPAHHADEGSANIRYSRRDAQMMVSIMAAILAADIK